MHKKHDNITSMFKSCRVAGILIGFSIVVSEFTTMRIPAEGNATPLSGQQLLSLHFSFTPLYTDSLVQLQLPNNRAPVELEEVMSFAREIGSGHRNLENNKIIIVTRLNETK